MRNWIYTLFVRLGRLGIILAARLLTAVRGVWDGVEPDGTQRVYYANHTSNADTVLIWTVLPPRIRAKTRPVAAADYWRKSKLRYFFGADVLQGLLIDRVAEERTQDPVELMSGAIDAGNSLIIFPEGKRNMTDALLLEFKTGIYHLAKARPDLEFCPVWIENLNRVLPKGEVFPVPLLCTVTFGAGVKIEPNEDRDSFLTRAHSALWALGEAQ